MALKITQTIGTSQGITDEAYVRIDRYDIDKINGNLNINVSMYLNKSSSISTQNGEYGMFRGPIFNSEQIAQNVNYPNYYTFPLTSSIKETVPLYTPSQSLETFEFTEIGRDGVEITGSRQEWVHYVHTGSQEVIKSFIDLSLVENGVFELAYSKLKEQLEAITGPGSIEHC